MATFSIGSFGTDGTSDLEGFGFTPNVSGPNGSGSPGSASTVTLQTITLGYPSSDTSKRPIQCWVYSVKLTDPSEIGLDDNLVGTTTEYTDGSAFGTGTNSRSFGFEDVQLNASQTYYAYFDDTYPTDTDSGHPYNGGDAYDGDLDVIANTSPQFKVVMST